MKNKSHIRMYSLVHVLLTVLIAFVFSSCKKEDGEDFNDPNPVIDLNGVSPSIATEFSDSLVFSIHYRDNDGDLGENDPAVKNLYLKDNRIGIVYSYRIQQLAPSGSNVPIEGDLNVVLSTIARIDTTLAQETATFSIYVKDRADHTSNTITTGSITIKAQ